MTDDDVVFYCTCYLFVINVIHCYCVYLLLIFVIDCVMCITIDTIVYCPLLLFIIVICCYCVIDTVFDVVDCYYLSYLLLLLLFVH